MRGVREVRLTGADGEAVGVVTIAEAMEAANEAGM
ncbi:MAG: translation initiation factor IF-3, partial [Vibrio toranzoniae]